MLQYLAIIQYLGAFKGLCRLILVTACDDRTAAGFFLNFLAHFALKTLSPSEPGYFQPEHFVVLGF